MSEAKESLEEDSLRDPNAPEISPRERRRNRRRNRAAFVPDSSVPSPCIKVCEPDEEGFCLGCRRSVDEIRDWYTMTAEEKKALLPLLEARKQARA